MNKTLVSQKQSRIFEITGSRVHVKVLLEDITFSGDSSKLRCNLASRAMLKTFFAPSSYAEKMRWGRG